MSNHDNFSDLFYHLPTVSYDPITRKLHCWSCKPSGVWEHDMKLGKSLAQQTITIMRQSHDESLLTWLVQDMPQEFSFVEIEFLHEVGRWLLKADRST